MLTDLKHFCQILIKSDMVLPQLVSPQSAMPEVDETHATRSTQGERKCIDHNTSGSDPRASSLNVTDGGAETSPVIPRAPLKPPHPPLPLQVGMPSKFVQAHPNLTTPTTFPTPADGGSSLGGEVQLPSRRHVMELQTRKLGGFFQALLGIPSRGDVGKGMCVCEEWVGLEISE